MTMRAVIACAAAAAACGDNLARPEDPLAPVSGARLALQRYRFDDGTEQVVASEFYDTALHTRCSPAAWRDGAVRCVPIADDAVYADPACSAPIGLVRAITRPVFFVARDTGPAGPATRVFRAGTPRGAITVSYAMTGGSCTGPTPIAMGVTGYYAAGDELADGDLAALHATEIGDGRLALELRTSDDGLRVPSGLRDRALGAACAPGRTADGSWACMPSEAMAATYYADRACTAAVVAVAPALAAAPAIAQLTEPSGCASYHRLAGEVAPPVYRRDGTGCAKADPPAGRLFALDAALPLAALVRTREAAAGRRLARELLDAGGLTVADDRLFDSQVGADCRPRALRDQIRCVPTELATAIQLYSDPGCTTAVRIAEVPAQRCEPLAYATTTRPFQIRTIGEVAPGPLYELAEACQRYAGTPGTVPRQLGPVLDVATLPSAIYFSDR